MSNAQIRFADALRRVLPTMVSAISNLVAGSVRRLEAMRRQD